MAEAPSGPAQVGDLGEKRLGTMAAVAQALAIGPMFSTAIVLSFVSNPINGAGFNTALAVLIAGLGASTSYTVSVSGALTPVTPSVRSNQSAPCWIVYAKGHGQGQRGPDADQGGFDSVSYWARGGLGRRGFRHRAPLCRRWRGGDAPQREA